MSKVIHLTDNYYEGTPIDKECIPDVLQIANISRLKDAPDLLVFPHSFSDLKDDAGDLSILTLKDAIFEEGVCASVKACTGNLMGFVGINDTSISIHSRFTHKKECGIVDDQAQDYFLYYLLQKVLSINIFSLEHTSSTDDKVLDFLLFLFPMMLKKAMSQGLFREYQTRCYDDAKVKGAIDINRFIRYDIPFKGSVSYTTHERSSDNSITQLIRHTVEYIKRHPFGLNILSKDVDTIGYVNQIIQATPTYSQRDCMQVLNVNRRPKVHPYYTAYTDLQQLCIHILRHDTLKYGKEKNKIHGVLFDGAWLWEAFLNTILGKCGFSHPENKKRKGGLPMFEEADIDKEVTAFSQTLYPDFHKDNFIIDAKYKHLNNGIGREDLYQVVTYMYCREAQNGGYVYPYEEDVRHSKHQLKGYNGYIYLMPFHVPQSSDTYKLFIEEIKKSEDYLSDNIMRIQ